jgi:thiol-disulfide isomerase/thioredoxin
MKQQHALWLVGVTSVLTLATIGFMGYRLYNYSQQPSQEELAEQARLSRQVSSDAAQVGVDALLASTLPDLEGRPWQLSQWRGKVLVINYWASWCPPCIEEMPMFSRLHEQHAAQGVQFVGIGLDETEKMQTFAKVNRIAYPLLAGGTNPNGSPALTVRGLPYTVVLGRDGKVAFSRYGSVDEATLAPLLRRLVEQK